MRNFLICLFVVLFYSCEPHYTEHPIILQAEQLLDTHTDSAYNLLNSFKQPEKMNKADYAAWCLHYSYCQYKLQKEFKTDSLIRNAIVYFEKTNLKKYTSMSYFIMGHFYSLKIQNNEALVYFKKAEQAIKGTNEFKLKGLIAFNIGYLCLDNQLYKYSLQYYKNSLKYFQQAQEPRYEAYACREISNMYSRFKSPIDTILYYSNRALKLSEQANDTVNYYSTLIRQGIFYYENGDFKLSKKYILAGFNYFPKKKAYNATFLAYDYSMLNQPDSAKYYLNISLSDTIEAPYRIVGLKAAALMAKNKCDYKTAFHFLEKAYARSRLTYDENINSQLYRIDKQYNLSEKERENAALALKNRTNQYFIAILIIVLLVLVVVFLIVRGRMKKINAQSELEKRELQHNAEIIKINNAQKQDIIRIRLSDSISNTLTFNKLKKSFAHSLKKDEFYTQLAQQSILSEDVWDKYIDEVNQLYDNRIGLLKEQYKLTPSDLIVIALICFDISISDSCVLLNMTRNTMYTRRRTIKTRIGIDNEIDLEEWLKRVIVSS